MTQKLKKMACALMAATMLVAAPITAYAQTVYFDITIPNDTISPRVVKDNDGEQKFYVTGTSFNIDGVWLKCVSRKLDQPSLVYSNSAWICSTNTAANALYASGVIAPGNQLYYMETSQGVSGLHVLGRYTP